VTIAAILRRIMTVSSGRQNPRRRPSVRLTKPTRCRGQWGESVLGRHPTG
jgi:hypothetical protein